MARVFIGSLTAAKYSLGLVLLVALLQGSSCPWLCDAGSMTTLSETQELADVSSTSRSQVEADIDEFYDWLWSFDPYTAAFGNGDYWQEGEHRTQATWDSAIDLPYIYGVNFFAQFPSSQDNFLTIDFVSSYDLHGYREGRSGLAVLIEPKLYVCSTDVHPQLTVTTYPNSSADSESDADSFLFRGQISILMLISKGMITKAEQPDFCLSTGYSQSGNNVHCPDDTYEWQFNTIRIPGEQITALMDDLAAQGIVYEYPDEPIY